MTLSLGVTLPQFTDDPGRLVDAARCAEDVGIDSVWVFDHLWPLSGSRQRPFIECWTALTWIARVTARVRLGTLVTRSSLRHPALVAKMAATVAAIAPGRLVVAIGSGDQLSRAENEAFGLPYYEADERIGQLRSVVHAVRALLNSERVTMSDSFVELDGLRLIPRPDSPPPVWVGGRSDDVLEIAGTIADGWNAWSAGPGSFARDAASVLDYSGGRALTLSWGGQALLGRDEAEARSLAAGRNADAFVVGGPESMALHLAELHDAGAHEAVLAFPDAGVERYRLLGERVRPLLDTP